MSSLPSGFKTREEYNAYMNDYRKRRRAEKKAQEEQKKLTKAFKKAMKVFEAKIDENSLLRKENLSLKQDVIFALSLFHDVHSIAFDSSLSDSEARERIKNFGIRTPPYYRDILNELERKKNKIDSNIKLHSFS